MIVGLKCKNGEIETEDFRGYEGWVRENYRIIGQRNMCFQMFFNIVSNAS